MKKKLRQWHEWPESATPAAAQMREWLWDVLGKLDHVNGDIQDIATLTPGENMWRIMDGWRQAITDLMFEIDDFACDSLIDEELK